MKWIPQNELTGHLGLVKCSPRQAFLLFPNWRMSCGFHRRVCRQQSLCRLVLSLLLSHSPQRGSSGVHNLARPRTRRFPQAEPDSGPGKWECRIFSTAQKGASNGAAASAACAGSPYPQLLLLDPALPYRGGHRRRGQCSTQGPRWE